MEKELTTRQDMEEYEGASRTNARQRRDPQNVIGFQRYGLQEDTYYEPPEDYPDDAKDYLVGLARCGTMSGGAKLAGISIHRVYELRRQVEGFMEEEEIAKDCLTDAIEESLFQAGLGFNSDVTGAARIRALETALKANRSRKYNAEQKHKVDLTAEVTWLDLVKQAAKDDDDDKNVS